MIFLYAAELAANRRRDGAKGADSRLIPQSDVRDQHGEELESGDELMVSAEGRVIVTPVEDASVGAVLESRARETGARTMY